ncbi:hypothetical protein [Mycolicibacterium peregrinum]|uniref:Uncharacterized protein n=1 Tax=Mycolicibacterium peregrinum TaxID=43304 RepID=A0A4Z0HZP2_MYCPR|nr:hypothetical protein [Mycolicibacterium peregrinum]TGB45336.1 hypothetical protein EJD98_07735 [Mycolicibacterium peregrinum]TGB46185.1 hypothetical protein EJD94_04215 [Mycolicibacterium peregrinum]
MSYPDQYQPQQQPPRGPFPPAPPPPPPGPQEYGHPHNVPPGGAHPHVPPYGTQHQPPYYPPAAVTPQPDAKRNDGNGWGWQLIEGLLDLFSGSSSHGLGKSSRERVKTALLIFGITFGGIVALVVILAWIGR